MNGHLGCFHILPIMYKTLINGRSDNSSRYGFHFRCWYTQKWDCRIMIILLLVFWGNFILFSTMTIQFTVPPRVYKGSFHILTNACIVFLIAAILTGVCCSLRLWFAFLWWLVMLSTCSFTYWVFVCLLWEKSVQFLCPFLIDMFVFLYWVV